MPTPKPTILPRWGRTLAGVLATKVREPNEGKKDVGFGRGERPPGSYLNWLGSTTYDALKWLFELYTEDSAGGVLRLTRQFAGIIFGGAGTEADPDLKVPAAPAAGKKRCVFWLPVGAGGVIARLYINDAGAVILTFNARWNDTDSKFYSDVANVASARVAAGYLTASVRLYTHPDTTTGYVETAFNAKEIIFDPATGITTKGLTASGAVGAGSVGTGTVDHTAALNVGTATQTGLTLGRAGVNTQLKGIIDLDGGAKISNAVPAGNLAQVNMLTSMNLVKAMVMFQTVGGGSNPTIIFRYNVASIVNNGSNWLTVTFAAPFASTRYGLISSRFADISIEPVAVWSTGGSTNPLLSVNGLDIVGKSPSGIFPIGNGASGNMHFLLIFYGEQ